MGHFRKCAWALAFALALAPAASRAGAWPNAPGEGLLILAGTYDYADRGFDPDGRPREAIRYEKQEISLFGEYGLTRRITLVGRAALQDVTIENDGMIDTKSGLAASEIGARAVVFRRDWDVLSIQATLVLPGDVENVSDLRLGEGGRDYEARVLYGRSFALLGGDGFAEAQAGWRVRQGAPPDEARLDLTLGWSDNGWSAMAQAFGLYGTGATLPRRDYENLKLQASVARELGDRMQLQFGAFRTVAGRSIVQETAVFVAVWRRF